MAATITTLNHYFRNDVQYKDVKISIPAADILTLNATPIVIEAGQTGKIHTPFGVPKMRLNYGTTQLTVNTSLRILTNGATLGTNDLYEVEIGQAASTILDFTKVNVTVGPQYISGASMILQVNTGNPVGVGTTSTIDIYLSYKTITL